MRRRSSDHVAGSTAHALLELRDSAMAALFGFADWLFEERRIGIRYIDVVTRLVGVAVLLVIVIRLGAPAR